MTKRLLEVRTGRHPHEIAVIVASLAVGIVGTYQPEVISRPITLIFPWPWSMAYWCLMVLFGAVALFGVLRTKRIDGLLVERAGLTGLAFLYVSYVLAVFEFAGTGGLFGALLPGAFAIGSIARCWQIGTDLILIKSYLIDHPGDEVR